MLHALQPWPVQVWIGRHCLDIPAMTAAEWVGMLMLDPDLGGLEDLIDDHLADEIMDDIMDGHLAPDIMQNRMLEIVTLVSGRPWWVTLRLLYAAQESWDAIGGYLAIKGVNAAMMSFQAFMDALLNAILCHVDPKNHSSMMTKLKMPPKGVDGPKIDEAREADVFMAYMKG